MDRYLCPVLAGVPGSILCCVRMARELWLEFSVVDSFATCTFVFQTVPWCHVGLASSVQQQNLAQTLSPLAKNAEPHRKTCPLRVTPRMSSQEVWIWSQSPTIVRICIDMHTAQNQIAQGYQHRKLHLLGTRRWYCRLRMFCWIVAILDDFYDMHRLRFHALEHGRDQMRLALWVSFDASNAWQVTLDSEWSLQKNASSHAGLCTKGNVL